MKVKVDVALKDGNTLTSDVIDFPTREHYDDNVEEAGNKEWSNFTILVDGDDIIVPREAISYIRYYRATKVQNQ